MKPWLSGKMQMTEDMECALFIKIALECDDWYDTATGENKCLTGSIKRAIQTFTSKGVQLIICDSKCPSNHNVVEDGVLITVFNTTIKAKVNPFKAEIAINYAMSCI